MSTINPLRSATRIMRTLLAGTVLATGLLVASLDGASANDTRPRVTTNQQFLEDIALKKTR